MNALYMYFNHELFDWHFNFCLVCDSKRVSKYSHCLGNSPSHYKQTNIELPSGTSDNYGSLVQNLRDHPFKTSANFSRFLTPTPLPSAVFYYYPSANLANF